MRSRGPDPDALSAALDAFVALLLPRLADELAKRQADADEYSSVALPPRTSRRAFAERCRSGRVAGAELDGRVWRCARASWAASRSRPAPPKPPALSIVSAPRALSDEELADLALADAALRPTRRRAG